MGFIKLNKTNWHVNVFKAVYTVMFGNLLLLYEMRGTAISFLVAPYLVFLRASPATLDKMFRSNFGFLYKSWGRAFYLVFCGFMPLGLGTLGKAAGGTMFAAAALNFIVIFKVRSTLSIFYLIVLSAFALLQFPHPDSRPDHPLPGEYQQGGGGAGGQAGLGQPLFGGQ